MRGAGVLVGVTVFFLFMPDGASGQVAARLEFEVATVKPAAPVTGPSPQRGGPGSSDPGRVNYRSLSMKNLLMAAYDMKLVQISGPGWIDSERYDIVATVPTGATKQQVNVMLQNLLADRFKLTVHRETKDLPLYELVVGKSGSKMKPYVEDPDAPKPEPGKLVLGKDGLPVPPPGSVMISMGSARRRVRATKQTVSRLADMLSVELGRPVVDKTGLAGEYDYSLEFRPEGPNAMPPGQQLPPPGDDDAPNVLVAVQEDLGLRLEAKRGPVETLVVDSGEKIPSEN